MNNLLRVIPRNDNVKFASNPRFDLQLQLESGYAANESLHSVGCCAIRASVCISLAPAPPGSTWWNAGLRDLRKSSCAAASIAAPANWNTPSAVTSNATTAILNHSFGPKPRTKSSTQLLDFVNVLQTQDTRISQRSIANIRGRPGGWPMKNRQLMMGSLFPPPPGPTESAGNNRDDSNARPNACGRHYGGESQSSRFFGAF